ncbi:MAG: alcohol dehydrogenase [Mariniblastus sp.]|jgi:alcohol dehydrogenase
MKGVCFQNIESIACLDLPDPTILDPHDAIVQVSLAGLCGSDLHAYFGRETGLDAGTVMGHEFVGTVVEVGTAVSRISVGHRVNAPFTSNCGDCFYCEQGLTARCVSGQLFGWRERGQGLHGGQSEFVRVPLADGTLKQIPESISDASALLLGDNFSTGFYCAEMADVKPDGVYVVVGCGTVGLLCILAAQHMGATKIYALDPIPERRHEAESLGAIGLDVDESAIEKVFSATDGRGADAVMELVGLPAAQKLAYRLLRPGGIMSVVGCHCTEHFSFSPVDAFDKNLTYRTGRCSARWYMDRLTDLVADGTFQLDSFVSRRFGVSDAVEAYDVFSNRKDGCLKAAIEFS